MPVLPLSSRPDGAQVRARLLALVGLPPETIPIFADELMPSGGTSDGSEADGSSSRPSPSVAIVVGVLAVVSIAVAGWLFLRSDGSWTSSTLLTPGVSVSSTGAPGPAPSGGLLVVDVVGDVRHPGLVRVAAGSRVADALAAAGGLRSHGALGGVNLARRLVDGEQVVIGAPASAAAGGAPTGPAGSGGSAGSAGTPLDLNTADLATLDTLPGVGPVTAQRILDFRTEHGRFASVDQLREVTGIGTRTFARLSPLVRVG